MSIDYSLSEKFVAADQILRTMLPPKFHGQIQSPQFALGGKTPVQHVANGGDIQTIQHLFQPSRGC